LNRVGDVLLGGATRAFLAFAGVDIVILVGGSGMGDDPLPVGTITFGAPLVGAVIYRFGLIQVLGGSI